MGVGDGMDVTGTSPGWWCVRSSQSRVERGLDTNRNDKGKGRRKTGFPSVGASLPGVGWVTHLGLAASAPQPEVSTARSQESGTLGGLSPAFPSHLLSPHPSALPSSAEKELEAWGGRGADSSFGRTKNTMEVGLAQPPLTVLGMEPSHMLVTHPDMETHPIPSCFILPALPPFLLLAALTIVCPSVP